MESAWDELLNFESRELVAKDLLARNPEWDSTRAKFSAGEISAALRQARDYFLSAKTADPAIKPLLLYYGVLGLTRGLILFSGHRAREANLDQRHGLSAKGWGNHLASQGGSFDALSVTLDRHGTFRELVEATRNRTFIRSGSSAVGGSCDHNSLPTLDTRIDFGNVIARFPTISPYSRRWLEDRPYTFEIFQVTSVQPQELTLVCSSKDESFLADVIGKNISYELLSRNNHLLSVRISPNLDNAYVWSDGVRMGSTLGIGHAFLIQEFCSELQLSQIAAVFIVAYVLGMLARYHPSHWTALIRNERLDAALPTMRRLVSYVEERFPAMTLDFLLDYRPKEASTD